MDIEAMRRKLADANGPQYWRSLDELAQTDAFRRFIEAEFPDSAETARDGVTRRDFLKFMAASLALAGLSGCTRQPPEKVVPYVKSPEELIPGRPLFYTTAVEVGACVQGVLVESHMGRPTKIEGNALHPDSLGATDAIAQAAILGLYDPERSQVVKRRGLINTWENFTKELQAVLELKRTEQGKGLAVLTRTLNSPSLADSIDAFLQTMPQAKAYAYEPVNRDAVYAGARLAFGEVVSPLYDLSKAKVILSLDADLFSWGPGHVRHIKEFSKGRRIEGPQSEMNRLYVVEPTPTVTGSKADHRLALSARYFPGFVHLLAAELGLRPGGRPETGWVDAAARQWIRALAKDLKANPGKGLIVAGDAQPAEVHAWAHALNAHLNNAGKTVRYVQPPEQLTQPQFESIAALAKGLASGAIDTLLILDGNPVYDAPAGLDFAAALRTARFSAHLGLYEDETSRECLWHLPKAHTLEAWGDVRAADGTVTIQQPLIRPLYAGRSALQVMELCFDREAGDGLGRVKDFWKRRGGTADFETFWKRGVHDGLLADTRYSQKTPALRAALPALGDGGAAGRLELVLRPDPAVWDGRFSNNGWLQELPKPLTKLTWENAALISPRTAQSLGLENEDLVRLTLNGRSIRLPVWILPGQADDSVTVHLGYGRQRVGRVGNGMGASAYTLRDARQPWSASGLALERVGKKHRLACTQHHHAMEGRDLVRSATLEEYRRHPDVFKKHEHAVEDPPSLYPDSIAPSKDYAWGLAIDMSACVGCNACVVACQSENNTPVVGKEQVGRGREMHWLRIDRYYEGDLDAPRAHHQPVMCMHCEKAPCEPVCPVGATVHSNEGLNEMVYNRCVGTRYCSNNCPYKVRRFNFLQFVDRKSESLKLMRNPDVTVRERGVMEKCTYCVQRINAARIDAKKEGRLIRDGEIVTACQAVCPAEAIVFGNLKDPESRVSRLKHSERHYGLLENLGTRPRTGYLASLRNPNPEIET